MRELWILIKLQLSSLFGINQILHMKNTEDKKQGKRALGALMAMLFALGYFSVLYSIIMAEGFAQIGMLPTLLGIMAMASSLLILMFSIFETKGVLLGFGDYDVVMSWPVGVRTVAASRVVGMYAYNFVYGLMLLLPAGIVYAIKANPSGWFYPLYLVLMLLLPALPTIVGALLGTVLTIATARAKKSSLISILAQFVLVIGLMTLSFRASTSLTDPSKIAGSADVLAGIVSQMYPPAQWFQDALTGTSLVSALWLLLLSAASITLLLFWLGRSFISINSRLKSKPRGEKFVMRRQARADQVTALFRREWKRYFSSSIYVVNTAFSYVMLLAAGVALLVKADALSSLMNVPEMQIPLSVVPFVLAWIVSMGATTPAAISMEGRSLWIIKSMPVRARDWFSGKLAVTMVLAVPSILISSTLIVIGLKPGLLDAIWLYLTPLAYALAFGVFGLWLNIRMPRMDWKTEAEAVKQSGSVMISVFTGMGAALLPGIFAAVLNSAFVVPISLLAILLLTLVLWRSLMKSGERRLLMLH